MAHVSGGVIAAYIDSGIEVRHIITAVIMTAPGSILISKILVPETETPETLGTVHAAEASTDSNVLDAAARGTRDGLHLALNIAAMLIAFVGLVTLVNNKGAADARWSAYRTSRRSWAGRWRRWPTCWASPGRTVKEVGKLLGHADRAQRALRLRRPRQGQGRRHAAGPLGRDLQLRAVRVRQHQLDRHPARRDRRPGPERRHDLARLGVRALLAGTLANYLSACIAGVLL